MKHTGNTPAIYASPRRAYLILPGYTVPRNAKFIISHANLSILAWAFNKSTNGNLDGSREPDFANGQSYAQNAEAVLQRVVSQRMEPVSLEEFRVLRHALGSFGKADLGWRNFFYANDDPVCEALVKRGLMEKSGLTYKVTTRGLCIAGVIC